MDRFIAGQAGDVDGRPGGDLFADLRPPLRVHVLLDLDVVVPGLGASGLVGLYRGMPDEEIFARDGDVLRLTDRRALRPRDFYALIPRRDDIHRVRATSVETSVSIHLLTNDTGCVWRHATTPATCVRSGPATSTWTATPDPRPE